MDGGTFAQQERRQRNKNEEAGNIGCAYGAKQDKRRQHRCEVDKTDETEGRQHHMALASQQEQGEKEKENSRIQHEERQLVRQGYGAPRRGCHQQNYDDDDDVEDWKEPASGAIGLGCFGIVKGPELTKKLQHCL